MRKNSYIMCNVYCISDNFEIIDNNINDSIKQSKKVLLRSIVGNISSNKVSELLTGVEFDYSDIKIYDRYSKILRRNVVKEKVKRSVEPIHVTFFSEVLSDLCIRNINYEYISESDLQDYYKEVIEEFGTVEKYEKYLLNLKTKAYNKLNEAVKKKSKCKKITKTRIV